MPYPLLLPHLLNVKSPSNAIPTTTAHAFEFSQALVTLAHDSVISLGMPVATAVNVAGAGTISNVVKLTVFTQAGNSNPSQFSVYSPAATSIDTTATSITMTLSGTATVYYVVTAINGSTESLSNAIPVAATTPFECNCCGSGFSFLMSICRSTPLVQITIGCWIGRAGCHLAGT
jgi:hypothetical protein